MRAPERRSRAGLTLLEVVIALSITSLVLLGARLLFAQLADGAERVAEEAAASDEEANGARYLRELIGRMDLRSPDPDGTGGHRLEGDATGADFWTWCDVPAGWQELCHVTLALQGEGADSSVLVVRVNDGKPLLLRGGLRGAHLGYLSAAGMGGTWLPMWNSVITLPLALGVLSEDDTMIVRVGERG